MKNTEFIPSSEIECLKSGNFIGWGESDKVILQVSIYSSFSGTVEKIFGQRWLSPPYKKIGPYAYASVCG